MSTRRLFFSVALCSLLGAGCERGITEDPLVLQVPKPLSLESALLYVDQVGTDALVRIVDVSRATPRISEYWSPGGNAVSQARPQRDGKQAVVLTRGLAAAIVDGKATEDVPSYLIVYEREKEVFRKKLGGRFTELTLSEDGRTAIVHGEDSGIGWGNTVSVVDLEDIDAPARNLSLGDSTGRAPISFVFSPHDAVNNRRLLLVRGYNSVRLVDLEHLDRPSKEIPLTTATDSRELVAGKVIFRPNEIYIQLVLSEDVLVLQLIPSDAGAGAFTVTPLTLAAAGQVSDVELVGEGEALRLVAVTPNAISIIDPVTADAVNAATDSSSYARLIPFTGRSPFDDVVRERGLLVPYRDSRIAFVDFDQSSMWSQQAFEKLVLPDRVTGALPVLEHNAVVLFYENTGMGLVDLARRVVTPIRTAGSVKNSLLDTAGGEAKLWVGLSGARVACIDLLRLQTTEILLNAEPISLLMLGGTPRRLAVIHDAISGYVTLLDPEKPARDSARELASFFYTDLLD